MGSVVIAAALSVSLTLATVGALLSYARRH